MEVNAAQNRVLYHQMRGIVRVIAGPRDPRIVPPTWATLQYYDATVNYDAAVRGTLAAIRDGDARWTQGPRLPTMPNVAPTSPVSAAMSTKGADPSQHAVTAPAALIRTSRTSPSRSVVAVPVAVTLNTPIQTPQINRTASIFKAVTGINYGSSTMIVCQLLGGYMGLLIDLMINRGIDLRLGFEGKGFGPQGFGGGVLTAFTIALVNTIFILIYGLPVFGGTFMAISFLGGLLDSVVVRVFRIIPFGLESLLRAAFFWLTPVVILYTLPPLANWATFTDVAVDN
jgi:hypothetical protein